jgi:NAD-dependent dihydropyrimidine dehydrogenase PreA subunit
MGLLMSDEVNVARSSSREGLAGLLRREWDWWMQASRMQVQFDGSLCIGCLTCYEVCPVGCFARQTEGVGVRLASPVQCVACGACALQCPTGAASLGRKDRGRATEATMIGEQDG